MADVLIINVETGEQRSRALTPEEQAQRDRDVADTTAREQARANAEAAAVRAKGEWRASVQNATSLEALKAALLAPNSPL